MRKNSKTLLVLISAMFALSVVSSGFAELRTDADVEDNYWKNLTEDKQVVPRYQRGRTVKNDWFEVKNLSFNRRNHSNGQGDYLNVTFDLFNLKNKAFEGYIFVVASSEKRYKKGAHFYVLIDNITPNAQANNVEYSVREGFFPTDQKIIANDEKSKEILGSLTKEELLNNDAKDPQKGIPIRIEHKLQVDIKHFIPYSKEERFFDHVNILIYGKEKQKMIVSKIVDDPKNQDRQQSSNFEEKNGKKVYHTEEKFPLLYAKRVHLSKERFAN